VASGLPARSRLRILRATLAALALVYALVSVSSSSPVDVTFAVMEGATKLLHGVLPYGHMPGDVVHGDTYPILSYALYTPVALLAPVSNDWDSVDLALGAGVAVALATALALALAAGSGRRRRPDSEREAGLRAALAWLTFPPVLITVSTGTTDPLLAFMVLIAVLLWRRPAACAALLTAAGWFKLAPAALLPLALARLRGRSLAAAVAAVVATSAPVVVLVLALGGAHGALVMAHAVAFQFSRGSPQSVWTALGISRLQPIGEAAVLALIAGAAVRWRREPELALDRSRAAALAAAILIGLELSANYWAFLYLVWLLPLLCVSVLAASAQGAAVGAGVAESAHPRTATAFA
jgi:hypothetical protein